MPKSRKPFKLGRKTIYAASLEDASEQKSFYRNPDAWIKRATRAGNVNAR